MKAETGIGGFACLLLFFVMLGTCSIAESVNGIQHNGVTCRATP